MKTMLTMKITVAIIKQKKHQKTWMWTWLCYDHDHVHAKMSLRANRVFWHFDSVLSFDMLTSWFDVVSQIGTLLSQEKNTHPLYKSTCGLFYPFYPWLDRENPLWRIEPTQIQVMQHKTIGIIQYPKGHSLQSPIMIHRSIVQRAESTAKPYRLITVSFLNMEELNIKNATKCCQDNRR